MDHPECPSCGSDNTDWDGLYDRLKQSNVLVWCRDCGCQWKTPEKTGDNEHEAR